MIKIAFADWWEGFDTKDNFITRAIGTDTEYTIITDVKDAESVDYVFCSTFGNDFLYYKCPRILFVGENVTPDFVLYDYGIGFDHLIFEDRYTRFPLYAAYYSDDCSKIDSFNTYDDKTLLDREFCSFVVSNSCNANTFREDLFFALSEYKKVDSGGRYLNNIGLEEGVTDKQDFLSKHKFNIACENSSRSGYCTEKIVQAFAAGTIPIYWGDPRIKDYFNPKAFINCHDFDSINQVIDHIKAIDQNDDLYLEMVRQDKIIEPTYSIEEMERNFRDWILNTIGQDKKNAYRRPLYGWGIRKEMDLRDQKFQSMNEKNNHVTKLGRFMNRMLSRF